MGGPGSGGQNKKSAALKALGGNAGERPPAEPSRPTPEAIVRAVRLEALGDDLLARVRVSQTKDGARHNWEGDLKIALACYKAAGDIRYRAAGAPPVVTPQSLGPYEDLLARREAAGRR